MLQGEGEIGARTEKQTWATAGHYWRETWSRGMTHVEPCVKQVRAVRLDAWQRAGQMGEFRHPQTRTHWLQSGVGIHTRTSVLAVKTGSWVSFSDT